MKRFTNFTNNFKETDGLLNKVNLLTKHFPNLQTAVKNTAETFKKTKSVTATLSTGFQGLWGIIKAHPIIAVITALSILNSIIDACTITTEEYNEILEKSRQELNDTTSKIESLSSELATTQDRIDELESKDNLIV